VAGRCRGGDSGSVVALIGYERRFGAPRRPASSPTAPGRKGDREGYVDSVVKYSEVGLTEKGVKVGVASRNPLRNR
jgi:hypothetical protein